MSNYKLEIINQATERLRTCYSCDKFDLSTKTCLECGCSMLAKVKLPQVECPIHKFDKMDEEIIAQFIADNQLPGALIPPIDLPGSAG